MAGDGNRFTARGFTLIEVLVGLVVLGVGLIALARFQGTALTDSGTAKARTQALDLAQQQIALLRNFANTAGYNAIGNGGHAVAGTAGDNATFYVCWNASSATGPAAYKKVKVSVYKDLSTTPASGCPTGTPFVALVTFIGKQDPVQSGAAFTSAAATSGTSGGSAGSGGGSTSADSSGSGGTGDGTDGTDGTDQNAVSHELTGSVTNSVTASNASYTLSNQSVAVTYLSSGTTSVCTVNSEQAPDSYDCTLPAGWTGTVTATVSAIATKKNGNSSQCSASSTYTIGSALSADATHDFTVTGSCP